MNAVECGSWFACDEGDAVSNQTQKKAPNQSGLFVGDQSKRLLEQRLARQAILLEDFTKALEAFYLNLPHPFPSQADLQAYVLQRAALVTAQAEAADDHLALLVGQFGQPLIDAL